MLSPPSTVQQCNTRRRRPPASQEWGRRPLENEQELVVRQRGYLSGNGKNGANGKTARESMTAPFPTNVTRVICVTNVTATQPINGVHPRPSAARSPPSSFCFPSPRLPASASPRPLDPPTRLARLDGLDRLAQPRHVPPGRQGGLPSPNPGPTFRYMPIACARDGLSCRRGTICTEDTSPPRPISRRDKPPTDQSRNRPWFGSPTPRP